MKITWIWEGKKLALKEKHPAYKITGCKQVPLKGHATTTFENVSQKNWKVFWNIFHFCHRWIWCSEKIKEYLTFYAHFNRMQNFFHFRRWKFFFKKQLFFVNVFSKKGINDNRSVHMISSFPFFILRCNMNTHREVLTGYEMNTNRRRTFSNFFASRSNDISWTFIYKYLVI